MPVLANIKKFYGMITSGSDKAIPPDYCWDQKDMAHTYLDTLSTRPGFTKEFTTAFSGGLLGIFDYRRKNGQRAVISATDNGDIVVGSSE